MAHYKRKKPRTKPCGGYSPNGLRHRLGTIIEDMSAPTLIKDLVAQSDLGARGFRAVVMAIYRGGLTANRRAEIDYGALVSVEGAA